MAIRRTFTLIFKKAMNVNTHTITYDERNKVHQEGSKEITGTFTDLFLCENSGCTSYVEEFGTIERSYGGHLVLLVRANDARLHTQYLELTELKLTGTITLDGGN